MQFVSVDYSVIHESLKLKSAAGQNHVIHVHVQYAYIYCTHLLPRIIFNNTPCIYTNLTMQGLVSFKFIKPGPLLATRTKFGNQKWSGVGPILAAKLKWSARTNFRVTVLTGTRLLNVKHVKAVILSHNISFCSGGDIQFNGYHWRSQDVIVGGGQSKSMGGKGHASPSRGVWRAL